MEQEIQEAKVYITAISSIFRLSSGFCETGAESNNGIIGICGGKVIQWLFLS